MKKTKKSQLLAVKYWRKACIIEEFRQGLTPRIPSTQRETHYQGKSMFQEAVRLFVSYAIPFSEAYLTDTLLTLIQLRLLLLLLLFILLLLLLLLLLCYYYFYCWCCCCYYYVTKCQKCRKSGTKSDPPYVYLDEENVEPE